MHVSTWDLDATDRAEPILLGIVCASQWERADNAQQYRRVLTNVQLPTYSAIPVRDPREVCLHEEVEGAVVLERCICVVVVRKWHSILGMKSRKPLPEGKGRGREKYGM